MNFAGGKGFLLGIKRRLDVSVVVVGTRGRELPRARSNAQGIAEGIESPGEKVSNRSGEQKAPGLPEPGPHTTGARCRGM